MGKLNAGRGSNRMLVVLKGLLKKLERELVLANSQREWLIQEIHHRVKNNLQIIISLLDSQSAFLPNEEARQVIRSSQHRMFAISLIHQQMLEADSLSSIDAAIYVERLIDYLLGGYNLPGGVDVELDVASFEMDVSVSVPFALIVNEAVSNSLQYAFPDGRSGLIRVSLRADDNHICELTIKDNGVGLPLGFDLESEDSLGFVLIKGLALQLNGQVGVYDDHGLAIVIRFECLPLRG